MKRLTLTVAWLCLRQCVQFDSASPDRKSTANHVPLNSCDSITQSETYRFVDSLQLLAFSNRFFPMIENACLASSIICGCNYTSWKQKFNEICTLMSCFVVLRVPSPSRITNHLTCVTVCSDLNTNQSRDIEPSVYLLALYRFGTVVDKGSLYLYLRDHRGRFWPETNSHKRPLRVSVINSAWHSN